MLRDSLGGKCLTNMIVTVSQAMVDASESLTSLQFGGKVQLIENNPLENVIDNNQHYLEKRIEPKR